MWLLYQTIASICRFPFIFRTRHFSTDKERSNTINWLNHNPTDNEGVVVKTYRLTIDFSGEWRESVKQPSTVDQGQNLLLQPLGNMSPS